MTADRASSKRAFWAAACLVVLGTVAAFARGVANPFITGWDDGKFIVDNPAVHTISLRTLGALFSSVREESFQPLHWLSYWVDVPWFGADACVVHAVSLAWWCLDLVLLLRVLQALGLSLGAATIATLVFGAHPIHVEVVTWASGRKDVVALMFVLLAVLMHLRDSARARWASRAFYLCACLSKTVAVPLPLVLALMDVLLFERTLRSALRRQLPNLAIALGLGAVVVWIWSANEMIRPDMAGTGAASLPIRVAATLTHHLATFVWPAKLSPHYGLLTEGRLEAWMLLGPALVIFALAWCWRRRDRQLAFAVLSFLVLLGPVSNVIPLYLQWQDRYLSEPMLGLVFGVGILLDRARERVSPKLVMAFAAIPVLALIVRTAQYTEAWSSERRLWEHAVATQPDAFFAWMKLGELHRNERRYDASIWAYEHALAVSPRSRLASSARFVAIGLRDEQRQHLEGPSRALELAKRYYVTADDPMALREWAGELITLGYRGLVMAVFDRSLELDPVSPERLRQAAEVQRSRGNGWLAEYYERRASPGSR